jgi:hypothetical protein
VSGERLNELREILKRGIIKKRREWGGGWGRARGEVERSERRRVAKRVKVAGSGTMPVTMEVAGRFS